VVGASGGGVETLPGRIDPQWFPAVTKCRFAAARSGRWSPPEGLEDPAAWIVKGPMVLELRGSGCGSASEGRWLCLRGRPTLARGEGIGWPHPCGEGPDEQSLAKITCHARVALSISLAVRKRAREPSEQSSP
jgi:hypothetical protein